MGFGGARWEGWVKYRRIYNGFPVFWLAVFSMAWYKRVYTVEKNIRFVKKVGEDDELSKLLSCLVRKRSR